MTSANVYYISFVDKETGKSQYTRRQNILCNEVDDWDKILSLDPNNTYLHYWGYDVEDEYWEDNKNIPRLSDWLEKQKIVNKKLREKINDQTRNRDNDEDSSIGCS